MKTTTAVVLGASSGVGSMITRQFANTHGRVYGFHRGHYNESADGIVRDFDNVIMATMDAGTTYHDVVECVAKLETDSEYMGDGIDVVVHSLSGAAVGSMATTKPEDVEKTFNRLAHSYLWWVQRLLKTRLLAHGCTFVALLNPCPDFYLTNSGVIGAAKAALESYVKLLGCELARYGNGKHRTVGIRFSTVITPALEKLMPESIPGLKKLHRVLQPQGRIQDSLDVAEVVHALTQPGAHWINGTIVDATGAGPRMLMDYAFRSAAKL